MLNFLYSTRNTGDRKVLSFKLFFVLKSRPFFHGPVKPSLHYRLNGKGTPRDNTNICGCAIVCSRSIWTILGQFGHTLVLTNSQDKIDFWMWEWEVKGRILFGSVSRTRCLTDTPALVKLSYYELLQENNKRKKLDLKLQIYCISKTQILLILIGKLRNFHNELT